MSLLSKLRYRLWRWRNPPKGKPLTREESDKILKETYSAERLDEIVNQKSYIAHLIEKNASRKQP